MRVLFVISTLSNGGAERVCSVLANKFSQKHSVVLAKFDNKKPFFEIYDEVELVNLQSYKTSFLKRLVGRVLKIFALRKLIKNGNFDAVFSFLDSTNFLVLLSNFALFNKIIISEHTTYTAPKPFWVHILRKILYKKAYALSVLTKFDKEFYLKLNPKTYVNYNPIFIPKNSDLLPFKKDNLVIFVGRLVSIKNCQMFVRVASKLKDSLYKFIVVGDGSERENLQNLSQNLGANVEFIGEISEISQIYQRAKIIVSTSHFEGLGNTLIEAIFYNCVRVATKTTGAMELINDGFDGFLSDFDDEKMSQILLNLMQNDDLCKEISQNARSRLDDFDLDKIANSWEKMADLQ